MFRPYWALLGFATRTPGHRKRPFPLEVINKDRQSEWTNVPLENHPAALMLCAFASPLVLPVAPNAEQSWGPVVFIDYKRIEKLLPKYPHGLGIGRLYYTEYARMLAKIAHGYTHAFMRHKSFYPLLDFLLPNIILGKTDNIFQYVGSTSAQLPATTSVSEMTNYFEEIDGYIYAIIKIRLFSYVANSPEHLIVSARFSNKDYDELTPLGPK